jgi:hypothetical protein
LFPPWLDILVGTLFSLLIVAGPVVVSLMYPLVGFAGGWSTVNRRDYGVPPWRAAPVRARYVH